MKDLSRDLRFDTARLNELFDSHALTTDKLKEILTLLKRLSPKARDEFKAKGTERCLELSRYWGDVFQEIRLAPSLPLDRIDWFSNLVDKTMTLINSKEPV